MEDKKNIKLQIGAVQKPVTPILGRAELADGGVYVVRNRAVIGKYYAIVCPQCHKPLLVKAASAKPHKATCKNCNTSIYFIGKESPTTVAEPPGQALSGKTEIHPLPPNAKIVWGGLFSKKSYEIREFRKYYIGRKDDKSPSDIIINDDYVSRRSVIIEPIAKSRTCCEYKLTVRKTSNPVLVNGAIKEEGESIYLNFGDTIVMGNTTLTFNKRDKK